jgi:hypothetical protein
MLNGLFLCKCSKYKTLIIIIEVSLNNNFYRFSNLCKHIHILIYDDVFGIRQSNLCKCIYDKLIRNYCCSISRGYFFNYLEILDIILDKIVYKSLNKWLKSENYKLNNILFNNNLSHYKQVKKSLIIISKVKIVKIIFLWY